MSDNVTGDTELFDSESPESSADTGSDDMEQLTESVDDQNDVELKEPKKLSAEQQAQKQVDAWTQKVVNGDVDLQRPKDVKWLKKSIEKKLKLLNKQPEIQDLVAKEVAKKEDERAFQKLKESLGLMTLTKAQKKELQAEFAELAQALPKSKALRKALKIVGAKEEVIDVERLRNAALPKPGAPADSTVDVDMSNWETFRDLPLDKKMEIMEAKRRQGMNKI